MKRGEKSSRRGKISNECDDEKVMTQYDGYYCI